MERYISTKNPSQGSRGQKRYTPTVEPAGEIVETVDAPVVDTSTVEPAGERLLILSRAFPDVGQMLLHWDGLLISAQGDQIRLTYWKAVA
ncbi:hypothetical protein NX059_010375 [Plenodomus lindquistii]|nr:hypothetical protein NX059_010375 [Plenodomus lindquistii]